MTRERCIYLVRHGETEGESSIRYHGRSDVALSELGRAQVAGLIPKIRHVQFAAVVHSPLDRARESAHILIDGLLREPDVVEEAPDMIEVDFGAMEGLTEAEIASQLPEFYSEWKGGRATGFPEGETFAGFDERVRRAFDGMRARHPEGHLLAVVHKGIIKRGMSSLLQLSGEAMGQLDPSLGSLTVLSCGAHLRESVRLKHWNLTSDPI